MTWDADFERAFHPRAVALVGVTSDNPASRISRPGATGFMARLMERGFPGHLYPINSKATEILGVKAYPSLASAPQPIDLVIISVPAQAVPAVLEDCIAANARNVHIFTAGFEETGEEEGRRLAQEVKEVIRRGRLRVVGPNCMGIYVPGARLSMWPEGYTQGGPVAFVSQSGRLAQDYAEYGQQRGIRFSKSISYGNAYGLTASDFLEYFATDPDTRAIGMYLEGVVEGQRFLRLVREVNRSKPVIVWKGGLTVPGAKAVSSHTGSLAGQQRVWDAFYKQTGAVPASSIEEIADVTLALLNLPPPKGRRVGHVGVGGGTSVASADIYAREGLEVPTLTQRTRDELRRFIPAAGTSVSNPLDTALAMREIELLARTVETVAADPLVDIIVVAQHWLMLRFAGPEFAPKLAAYLADCVKENRFGKPLVVMLRSWTAQPGPVAEVKLLEQDLLQAGIPTYPTEERAVHALARFCAYHEFQRELMP
jgi:acyl-CoA synthetase (NDP forming)